ncbi:PARP-type domain-containing protein (Fragment), partial [Durusdinium trenchii]
MSKKTLTQDEYKSEVKALGARWKALSADEKADFNVLAAHQQSMLEELAHKPLPTKPESGIAPTTGEADQLDVWRNAQKKRSARRLDINSEAFERHPIWDSPTQLGDSQGALKTSMICVDSTDKDIEESLQATLHKRLDVNADAAACEIEPHKSPCYRFLCRKHKFFDIIQKFVGSFGRQLTQNKLSAGTLLLFSSEQCSSSIACFLGVVMKKPQEHMLLEATIVDAEIQEAYLALKHGIPQMHTSHELFLMFFQERTGDEPLTITAEAWRCDAFLDGHQLKTNPEEKVVLRKRRVSKKQKTAAAAQKQRQATSRATSQLQVDGTPDRGSDTSVGGSESSSSEECSDPEKESERVVPAFDAVAAQEKQLGGLADEMDSIDRLAQQIGTRLAKPEPSKVPKSNDNVNSGKASKRQSGSFFNSEIGLCEAAVA